MELYAEGEKIMDYNPKDDPGEVVDIQIRDGWLWVKVKFRLSGVELFGKRLKDLNRVSYEKTTIGEQYIVPRTTG